MRQTNKKIFKKVSIITHQRNCVIRRSQIEFCSLGESEVSAELRTPGHQDGAVDGQTVASVAEDEVAAVLAFVQIGQALTQSHCRRPET